LEDRRVLYDPYDVEIPHRCFTSVQEIRQELRGFIQQSQSSQLRDPLRAIQAACRQFLTDVQALGDGNGHAIDIQRGGNDSWLFNQALGSFRARVGVSVAVLVETFDIDVDEHIAKIMPPPVEEGPDHP